MTAQRRECWQVLFNADMKGCIAAQDAVDPMGLGGKQAEGTLFSGPLPSP